MKQKQKYPDFWTVNSPEAILADNSARRFSSSKRSTLLTPLSAESGSLPLEDDPHFTNPNLDVPENPIKQAKMKLKKKERKKEKMENCRAKTYHKV